MSQDLERAVARHYATADLSQRIYRALEAAGVDLARLTTEDLAPVDEFHIGGRAATAHAFGKLKPAPSAHVLDVGSGIGGAARYVAQVFGCRVTGIDLTPEFVEAAEDLTRRTGLSDRVDYQLASALAMPFEGAKFDAAFTFHVAMNIREREALYQEIGRVLKPGAPFLVYDVMKAGEAPLTYPVPWATTPETSHLVTPTEMRALLVGSGFKVEEVEDRTAFGIEFFRQRFAAAASSAPALGLHLLMGPDMRERFANMLQGLEAGAIAPIEMVARKHAA